MASVCPIRMLKMKPLCEFPRRTPKKRRLTPADEKALHQFLRRLITAADILYKKVPRERAEPIVRQRWLKVATELRREQRRARSA